MGSDPFGSQAPGSLTPDELTAITPVAMQVRDNALAIIQTVFGKESDVVGVTVNPILGADIESTLVGEYLLIESGMQGNRGELWPCMTFLHPEEVATAFELGLPADGADWHEQVEQLQHPIELLIDALNANLEAIGPGAPRFSRPSVRLLNLPEEVAGLLLAPDEQFLEISYQLAVMDVGEISVVTIAALDMARRLAGSDAMSGAVGSRGTPARSAASGGLRDDLLDQIGDPFATTTGRTPADILDDIPVPAGSPRGGPSMQASASSGYAGSSGGRLDPGVVRPAQFQQFGEEPSRETLANIDLIMDVNLKVSVELGRTTKTIQYILEMGPGTVIELDKLAGEPVDILVNDKIVAKGEVVVVDESFGVRVTEIVSPSRRIASLR